MSTNTHTEKIYAGAGFAAKIRSFSELLKFRLSLLVSLSAVFGYAMAGGPVATAWHLFLIGLGGFLITGASNALNQLFEKDLDAKMARTRQRPMPQQRLSGTENLIFAMFLAIAGIAILGYTFNLEAALLGIIGLLSYAFVYTPMKQKTPFAVFVGAIPGALPPLIGWVAFTGAITEGGIILFIFQFFWQFPHFWAIAWLMEEDYAKAGFRLLPTSHGRSPQSARFMLVYALCLVPLVWFPWQMGMTGVWTSLGLVVLGLLYAFPAWKLLKRPEEMKFAKKLLFASFLYLPLIEVTFLLG